MLDVRCTKLSTRPEISLDKGQFNLFVTILHFSQSKADTKKQVKHYDVSKIKNEKRRVFHRSSALVPEVLRRSEEVYAVLLQPVVVKEAPPLVGWLLVVAVQVEQHVWLQTRTYMFTCLVISGRNRYYPSLSLHFRKSDAKRMQPH
jgi:hypothetical protein